MNEIERVERLVSEIENYGVDDEKLHGNDYGLDYFERLCKYYLLRHLNFELASLYEDSDIVKNNKFLQKAVGAYVEKHSQSGITPLFSTNDEFSELGEFDDYEDCEAVFKGEMHFKDFITKYKPLLFKVALENYNFNN